MFRKQYEKDVAIWDPNGRLLQVEYAQNSVQLAEPAVGLKNKEFAVLVTSPARAGILALSNQNLVGVTDHLGFAICGLTADGKDLATFLRIQCQNYAYAYHSIISVKRLMALLGNKMHISTAQYGRRPYGAGLVVAGYDADGPHIYEVDPSANCMNCKAIAMGAGSPMARTYLESNLAAFSCSSLDHLICHGIKAFEQTRASEDTKPDCKHKPAKVCVAIVGAQQIFKLLSDQENQHYVEMAMEMKSDEDSKNKEVPTQMSNIKTFQQP